MIIGRGGYGRAPAAGIADKLGRLPWLLLLALMLIAGVGTAALYSVSGQSFEPWAERHAWRFAGGLGLALVLAFVPVALWQSAAAPAYGVALALLAAVPIVGTEALGARRWLDLSGVSVQPVEIMKVALVLALARLYASVGPGRAAHLSVTAVALAMIAIPAALTIRQPDLGSGLLLIGAGLGVMVLAGMSLWLLLAGAGAMALALPVATTLLHDYQRRRIEVFLDPDRDPLGAGYHIAQARIALGSGGLWGQGFGQGSQSQLDFVPEKRTDFIFVTIAEEWGFLGAAGLIGLYAVAIGGLLAMAIRARTPFARLVIGGVGLLTAIYVVINIAMVSGLVPVVGVPLPLVSYGGTATITLMIAIGIAIAAHVDRPWV